MTLDRVTRAELELANARATMRDAKADVLSAQIELQLAKAEYAREQANPEEQDSTA